MKPRSLRVAGILCLGTGLTLMVTGSERAPGAQAPPPTFPSQVEVVTVDVIVLDKEGHPVADLTRDDLAVEEDGEVREIVTFERFGGEIGTPPVALPVPP